MRCGVRLPTRRPNQTAGSFLTLLQIHTDTFSSFRYRFSAVSTHPSASFTATGATQVGGTHLTAG
jgi:hypothetical protein